MRTNLSFGTKTFNFLKSHRYGPYPWNGARLRLQGNKIQCICSALRPLNNFCSGISSPQWSLTKLRTLGKVRFSEHSLAWYTVSQGLIFLEWPLKITLEVYHVLNLWIPLKLSMRAFSRLLVSCMRLAILRETKKQACGLSDHSQLMSDGHYKFLRFFTPPLP